MVMFPHKFRPYLQILWACRSFLQWPFSFSLWNLNWCVPQESQGGGHLCDRHHLFHHQFTFLPLFTKAWQGTGSIHGESLQSGQRSIYLHCALGHPLSYHFVKLGHSSRQALRVSVSLSCLHSTPSWVCLWWAFAKKFICALWHRKEESLVHGGVLRCTLSWWLERSLVDITNSIWLIEDTWRGYLIGSVNSVQWFKTWQTSCIETSGELERRLSKPDESRPFKCLDDVSWRWRHC